MNLKILNIFFNCIIFFQCEKIARIQFQKFAVQLYENMLRLEKYLEVFISIEFAQ